MIIEYLLELAGSDRLLPARGVARFQALTRARLADGIMDASILVVYDSRFRPGQPPSERWLAHQRGKITRGLAAFAAAPPDPHKPTSSRSAYPARSATSTGASRSIGARPTPRLVEWLTQFSAHEPAFERTRAPLREELYDPNADTPADTPYWSASPSKPKLKLPPGSSDSHVHVFGPRARFPFAEGRNYTPSDATKEMLFALHEKLGIEHCVIVQPNAWPRQFRHH